MAQEKARPARARVKKETEPAEPAPKAKKPRSRPQASSPHTPDEVATLAYLMWERGEWGDATEHWLRAERELAA
jgi:hypothetical protein